MVRWGLLVGVGMGQAAALAAAQSRQAREIRERVRALRHGGSHPVRHYRRKPREAQRVRDGTQVDVEPIAGRIAAGELFGESGSATRRGALENGWRVRNL